MNPTRLASAPLSPPGPPGTPSFWSDWRELCREAEELWLTTEPRDAFPDASGEREAAVLKRQNGAALGKLLPELEETLSAYPTERTDEEPWRASLKELLRRRGHEDFAFPSAYLGVLLSDESFAATRDFANAARTFDASLRVEDVFQALRNVWIANSLQVLFDRPLRLTRGVLGYSLLYPFTDNHLDDGSVSVARKERFNRRFGRRLSGERLEARGPVEERAFRCVGLVEEEWPRPDWPDVHASLFAIHRGQVRSLAQVDGEPSPQELLAISVAKGGSSVLADGYLVAGRLSRNEASFVFLYGVFLQLLDDLQDFERDRSAGQRTLFSSVGRRVRTEHARRLAGFAGCVEARARALGGAGGELLVELVRKNGAWLFLSSIARAPHAFEASFLQELERRAPFALDTLRKRTREGRRRYLRVARRLARRGMRSPFDVLG